MGKTTRKQDRSWSMFKDSDGFPWWFEDSSA